MIPQARPVPLLSGLLLALLLAACASTRVDFKGTAPAAPICQGPGEALGALLLWGPQWRPNQKDVPLREEAARQGLESFLNTSHCFASHELRRLPGGASRLVPAEAELRALANAGKTALDRVIVVTVRELGPVVRLLDSAALVEGGTEVVLDLIVLNAKAGTAPVNFTVHWQNGGAMVIKGVATLPQDLSAALSSALATGARRP